MRNPVSLFFLLLRQGFDPVQIHRRMMIRSVLRGSENVLDVGCGKSMDLRWFGIKHPVGIEAYRPSFEAAKNGNTHDEVILGDVCELDKYFKPHQFDTCISVDVIEHVTKENGLKMMRDMERIATSKVIIVTPNGWMNQEHEVEGDLQKHFSEWDAKEMESYGYKVIGMLGLKALRGDGHALKYRPKFFWGVVSLLTQVFWAKKHSDKAASILCVKNLKA